MHESAIEDADLLIIHVDMDAFFASVEQRDDPSLRGKPVVVGGSPDSRGVVAAASYEVRKFGVRSAMPMSQALRLCPQVIRRPGRYEVYREVAGQIRTILHHYSPLVEPLSLDEAFLDVTGCEKSLGDAPTIGRAIKAEIASQCRLVASVGIGPVKFIAKLASDHGKPNGFVVIPQEEVMDFLTPLPVERIWGVGKATAKRLHEMKIRTVGELRLYPRDLLGEHFGSQGPHLWDLAHGIDPRPVDPGGDPKSISHESTFARDISDPDQLLAELHDLTDRVAARLRSASLTAKGLSLKIRFADFHTVTRSVHSATGLSSSATCWQEVRNLWLQGELWKQSPIRLLGVAATSLTHPKHQQLDLFDQPARDAERQVDAAIDEIRKRFGGRALISADRLATESPPLPDVQPRNSNPFPEKQ